MPVVAIIVAAGRGARAGSGLPKQYRSLGGRPVLARTLEAFTSHPRIDRVQPVLNWDDLDLYRDAIRMLPGGTSKLCEPVAGGPTRQVSVRLGLEAAASGLTSPEGSHVLIHDAARPFADGSLIDRAIEAGRACRAAVPGVPLTVRSRSWMGRGASSVPRNGRRCAPSRPRKRLRLTSLFDAHRRAAEAGLDGFTDDGALAEWAGLAVTVFEGEPANVKLTRTRISPPPSGVSAGRAETGHACRLGVRRSCLHRRRPRLARRGADRRERGVVAHSDGDVVLHALTDAVLGALAEGDIGVFPAERSAMARGLSERFLAFAAERVGAEAGSSTTSTRRCCAKAPDRPPAGPHPERIAAIAGLPLGAVSVKATTTERLGFIGRGEGLAAQAVATIRLPAGAPCSPLPSLSARPLSSTPTGRRLAIATAESCTGGLVAGLLTEFRAPPMSSSVAT